MEMTRRQDYVNVSRENRAFISYVNERYYRKAFDFVDHHILANKLQQLNIPHSDINWVIDFLCNRLQPVKLSEDCLSQWGKVPSGVPQGTKLGPWLFLLMIDDLSVSSVFEIWKYVDDTTGSECIAKGQCSNLKAQVAVDQVIDWSKKNLFQLNGEKTKELSITFSHNSSNFRRALIDGLPIESVEKTKLLGVTLNSSLTWNDHIEDLVKKAFRKLYFLVQLKRAQIPPKDLVAYYCADFLPLLL